MAQPLVQLESTCSINVRLYSQHGKQFKDSSLASLPSQPRVRCSAAIFGWVLGLIHGFIKAFGTLLLLPSLQLWTLDAETGWTESSNTSATPLLQPPEDGAGAGAGAVAAPLALLDLSIDHQCHQEQP